MKISVFPRVFVFPTFFASSFIRFPFFFSLLLPVGIHWLNVILIAWNAQLSLRASCLWFSFSLTLFIYLFIRLFSPVFLTWANVKRDNLRIRQPSGPPVSAEAWRHTAFGFLGPGASRTSELGGLGLRKSVTWFLLLMLRGCIFKKAVFSYV